METSVSLLSCDDLSSGLDRVHNFDMPVAVLLYLLQYFLSLPTYCCHNVSWQVRFRIEHRG